VEAWDRTGASKVLRLVPRGTRRGLHWTHVQHRRSVLQVACMSAEVEWELHEGLCCREPAGCCGSGVPQAARRVGGWEVRVWIPAVLVVGVGLLVAIIEG
jgi:hypothetical protein